MDWLLATPQIQSVFTSLGSFQGDTYVVSPNALDLLNEIEHKLNYEDQTLRTFRRAIGFCQNVRTDLIPLLVNAKDDDVLELVIRILVNLTIPVECLFSVDVMYRTDVGRHTIFELNKLLYTSKKAFTDPKSTKPVIDFIKHILQSDTKMTPPKCEQINNCLLLLRNVLHIPETHANFIVPDTTTRANGASCANVSMQNSILWNLFIQSIDKLLLYLITYHQRQFWGVTIVQLIGLLYKDQNVGTLQKLLNMWVEASLSDSSEDNESNTTLQKQASGDSSPMLTSDSSDNGKSGGELKRASSRHTYVYNRVIDLITSNTDVEAKDNACEERRQAQREITDVGSKDQSYQNSVCRMADPEDNRMTVECLTLVEVEVKKTENHSNENVEAMDGDFSARVSEACDETKEDEAIDMEQSSSVKKHISTDDMNFKSPSGLPVKAKCDAKSETENTIGQKIGNSVLPPKNDNGTFYAQKRQCASSQSEFTDGEYANQIDNTALVCTSSNDDDGPQAKPQHKKPPWNSKPRSVLSSLDKKELRRKKLVKRSKSSLINMKGLVQHIPTDEDISNLLKEFTVDFLLMGYGLLVEELHSQLLTDIKIPIDTSHFFWLVTYFLKFAAQLELDMKHVNTILNFDVISYLTYEGVSLCEQLDLNAREEGSDLKPYLRRIHLVVTAIQEFLQAIEAFKKIPHLTEEDREQLEHLQIQISATEDLRSLFILLLRRFNPALHTKQYLKDLIVTNHLLLIILDSVAGYSDNNKINMMEHISQFGTTEVMHYYGMLLEDFHNNGEFVNNCIFTTMHHIGGDLQLVSTLFQPVILKTFSRIWETEYDLCDDWTDLIEYVIHKFINTPQKRQLAIPKASLTELTKEHNLENAVSSWRKEDMDTLYWYYVQSKKNRDVVGKIVNLFNSNGKKHNTRISIIQQLLQQDIITLVEYDDLMKFEDAEYQRTLFKSPQAKPRESVIESKDTKPSTKPANDIEILKNLIIKEKKEKHLVWLQKILLECCYIKLTLAKPDHKKRGYQSSSHVMEPVAYHYILKNKPIPVVQWNNDQMNCMQYQPFILLLRKLGFQTPSETGTIYARVPESWTPATMFALAKKLGSLDKLKIKFDVRELDKVTETDLGMMDSSPDNSIQRNGEDLASNDDNMSGTGRLETVQEVDEPSSQVNYAFPKPKHCNSIIRSSPMPAYVSSVPNWLQLVMRSKCNVNLANASGQNIEQCGFYVAKTRQ